MTATTVTRIYNCIRAYAEHRPIHALEFFGGQNDLQCTAILVGFDFEIWNALKAVVPQHVRSDDCLEIRQLQLNRPVLRDDPPEQPTMVGKVLISVETAACGV